MRAGGAGGGSAADLLSAAAPLAKLVSTSGINKNLWSYISQPLEFLLIPVVGFFFSALPGMDAHTRLMFGKYLEYRVTEKVANPQTNK